MQKEQKIFKFNREGDVVVDTVTSFYKRVPTELYFKTLHNIMKDVELLKKLMDIPTGFYITLGSEIPYGNDSDSLIVVGFTPFKRRGICELLGIHMISVNKYFNKLDELDLIKKVGEMDYVFNPRYWNMNCLRGKQFYKNCNLYDSIERLK